MTTAILITAIALTIVSTIVVIVNVGKPRKPTTGGQAAHRSHRERPADRRIRLRPDRGAPVMTADIVLALVHTGCGHASAAPQLTARRAAGSEP